MTASDLTGLGLVTLHWDDRGNELTAAFEGPIRAPYSADSPEHTHIRLRLSLTGITALSITSWAVGLNADVTIAEQDGQVVARFTGPGTAVECTAQSADVVVGQTFRPVP
ncbi:hypothetical protein [Actinokineospora inagensis]|uniref:hypothetical protein n=1 Tax=Actinokineospora inagensis TaxID=103730 RepID=UPI000404F027|nr:hypothetical protein [Actinokineospora inagensis]